MSKKFDKTIVIILKACHFVSYIQNVNQHPAVKAKVNSKLLGIISVDFEETTQRLITYSA
jgi:hypothetical protein